MRLGTAGDLKVTLQGLGLSGRLNTAYIERVNLTIRHGIAALARRVVFPVIITCSFFHSVAKQPCGMPWGSSIIWKQEEREPRRSEKEEDPEAAAVEKAK
jgi:hypothetical protein